MSDDRMLDEATIRRALRLDADEPRPRFDTRAIAAVARATPARRVAFVALAASFITGLVAASVWSTALAVAPQAADELVSLILPPLVALATVVVPIAQAATDPVVPISIVAAIAVATLYELRERRERVHVHSS
jgi:hypothetical protein